MSSSSDEKAFTFASFSRQPLYNVKVVCKRTGIAAATLRAWERRYGLPHPARSQQGSRLYSERDLAILFWLRRQTAAGLSIAYAVRQLETLLDTEHDPQIDLMQTPYESKSGLRSPDILRAEMVAALFALDERTAEHLLSEVLAIYTLETTLITILLGAVHEVRELRQQGRISTTNAYIALNYAHQRLLNMAHAAPITTANRKTVVLVGFSAEHTEIDLLIISILLRRQGIPVTYLGIDLEPRMLGIALEQLNAAVVAFYADDPHNAVQLAGVELPPITSATDRVWGVCCGRALMTAPELQAHIYLQYLGDDLHHVIHVIAEYMTAIPKATP